MDAPRALVVTSIAAPTAAMRALADGARTSGTAFYCVGDEASPARYALDGCRFVPLAEQARLPLRLAALLPTRHYARKNLGYLMAMRDGAAQIVETDDDNAPLPAFFAPRSRQVRGEAATGDGWVNAFAHFTAQPIWPRGYPLDAVLAGPGGGALREGRYDCPVQQGLTDGDSDVDAVYRLTRNEPVRFRERAPLALGPGCWCPFNSQGTFWWRDAFALLYLPATCSFRMTDIWRSLVAQRCLWAADWQVAFTAPVTFQARNAHDLMADFAAEVPGYLHNAAIARALAALELEHGAPALGANLRRCYEALIEGGHVDGAELAMLDAWLADVADLAGAVP